MSRSICSVRVGAIIVDKNNRVVSIGWNNVGSGFGKHAEVMAIERANRRRLWYGDIYIASTRTRHGKPIMSKPCPACQFYIDKFNLTVHYRGADGKWHKER